MIELLAAGTAAAGVVAADPLGPRIAFWVCAAAVLGGAVFTITRRNTIGAVMSLVFTFFALAATYTLLAAHFLAAIQVLVYAGAIMTLFVFVVMVLNRDEQEPWALRGLVTKLVGIGAFAYLVVKLSSLLLTQTPTRPGLPPEGWGGVADVGNVLFTTYLFPFEAVSLMLLVAVIGAVVVARTPRRQIEAAATATQDPAAAEKH